MVSHLVGWVSSMLPALFVVSLLGDGWEGHKNWGRLFADWGGRLNEYFNDLNNFSAQKMLCKLFSC